MKSQCNCRAVSGRSRIDQLVSLQGQVKENRQIFRQKKRADSTWSITRVLFHLFGIGKRYFPGQAGSLFETFRPEQVPTEMRKETPTIDIDAPGTETGEPLF